MRRLSCLLVAGLAAAVATPAAAQDSRWPPDPSKYEKPGTEVAPGLKIGDTLTSQNADAAKDLMPPEVYSHFKKDEYQNAIDSWPPGIIVWEKDFEESTKQNDGKYIVDPKTNTVLEKATGKPPEYVYGHPFPAIAADDPQAGIKAVWNGFHNYWNTGSYNFNALIVWVAPDGVDRQSLQDVYFRYYENQAPRYRIPNPQGFSWRSLAVSKTPADLQGTAALVYRYRDPARRDSAWAYVPALRRVRAVSPANRSDGFLGSDLSQDDGNFFDAKPEDFEWKTIGIKEGLRFADAESIHGRGGKLEYVKATDGFRQLWEKNLPAAGYLKDGWKGIAWAPVSSSLVKRKFWVVQGVPRDRYYLYGLLELWIDAESWIGAYNRKFGWKNELLNTYQVNGYLNHPAQRPGEDETEWFWSSQHAWQCAEAVKARRATLAGLRSDMSLPFDRRLKFNDDQLFDFQTLSRYGK